MTVKREATKVIQVTFLFVNKYETNLQYVDIGNKMATQREEIVHKNQLKRKWILGFHQLTTTFESAEFKLMMLACWDHRSIESQKRKEKHYLFPRSKIIFPCLA